MVNVNLFYFQHLFKKVSALKSTEDSIKKSYAATKERIDKLKKGKFIKNVYIKTELGLFLLA